MYNYVFPIYYVNKLHLSLSEQADNMIGDAIQEDAFVFFFLKTIIF